MIGATVQKDSWLNVHFFFPMVLYGLHQFYAVARQKSSTLEAEAIKGVCPGFSGSAGNSPTLMDKK